MRNEDRHALPLLAVLFFATLAPSCVSVRDLRWPYDLDGFRDISIAQGMREGAWLADPFYRNERAWYNPLVPALVAIVSSGTGSSVERTYILLGLWLNLVGAFAFFICVRFLLGPWPALIATTLFMFLPGRGPAWASATYSPWLFPSITAQAPLYFGMTVCLTALEKPRAGALVCGGVLLGLTFLSHTASAILLVGVVCITAVHPSASALITTAPRRLGLAIVMCLIAALMSAPFLLPLISEYRLRVLNPVPPRWPYHEASVVGVMSSFQRPSGIVNALIVVTGMVFVYRRGSPRTRVVLGVWTGLATLLFLYSVGAERIPSVPSIVPAFHFLFMLRAVKWIVMGAGLVGIATALRNRWRSRLPSRFVESEAMVHILLAFGLVLSTYPRYLGRPALRDAPAISRQIAESPDRGVSAWIRENTDRDSIFLSSDIDALMIVGPAGRHVVCVERSFSNIYVDYASRAAARDGMFEALMRGDHGHFESLRRRFGVTHILLDVERAAMAVERSGTMVKPVLSTGSKVILEILNGASATGAAATTSPSQRRLVRLVQQPVVCAAMDRRGVGHAPLSTQLDPDCRVLDDRRRRWITDPADDFDVLDARGTEGHGSGGV